MWNLLDPRFQEVNSLTDFKVAMRTWTVNVTRCLCLLSMIFFMILYRYVFAYITVHLSTYQFVVHASSPASHAGGGGGLVSSQESSGLTGSCDQSNHCVQWRVSE